MSNTYETILKRRSIRRFSDKEISDEAIEKMINSARLAPSAANLQPLKYMVIKSPDIRDAVFKNTMWAGYVQPEGAPSFENRPRLFIAVLCDSRIKKENYELDAGLSIENMILTAQEESIGSCIIGAFHKEEVKKILDVPDHLILNCLIGFGYPAHQSVFYDESENVKYTMDDKENFHVPKRPLKDITIIK